MSKLIFLMYEDKKESIWIGQGIHTVEGLNSTLLATLEIFDPDFSIIALKEIDSEDIEVPATIPLELIAQTNNRLQSDRYYKPVLWKQHNKNAAAKPTTNHLKSGLISKEMIQMLLETPQLPPIPPVEELPPPSHFPNSEDQNQDSIDPWQNYEYFYQYGRLDIHNEMIRDEPRTLAYRDGLKSLGEKIRGKVVMDAGAGSGILSFFSAQAGAAKVYAVEASDIAPWTRKVVEKNNLSDTIKIVHAQLEKAQIGEKIDVLYESMLESVLKARDRFLKPDGIMVPSTATCFICPLDASELVEQKVDFWNTVHNVDMSPFTDYARDLSFEKPIIDKHVAFSSCMAEPFQFMHLDLKTVDPEEPYKETTVPFQFIITKSGIMHGFVTWFDVLLHDIVLSTSPASGKTHWNQQQFIFNKAIKVEEGDKLRGEIMYRRNKLYKRHLIIEISYQMDKEEDTYKKTFYMWAQEQ
ncbi:protein arginine N-methyltransferase 2 [Planoprotostelium fungivorum]|uniref:Protein arginine N-methyltransferase 2 n=1 Tax=Planoprotostelium fungivorum TaxID=1890364 RepID=A0A2P6MN21_9EUKA|nr:protein arginine N-methyltransferase 2 [Planoprotostelium fungivorum]